MRKAQVRRGFAGFAATAAALVTAMSCSGAAAMVSPRLKPPPPAPVYASRSDLDLLNQTREAINRRHWSEAREAASKIVDPTARSLGQWFYFYAEDPDVDFRKAGAFLDQRPDWPAVSKIQMHAEESIPDDAAPRAVLDFFDTRDPLTGDGELQLARALFASGDSASAVIHLRDAWVNHNFSLSEEQKLLSKFGRWLTEKDHAARVDRLLWARHVTVARRIFSRLNARDRRMAEARAALLVRASNAPKLYHALSAEERLDPGVLLAAVRYYRRTDEEPHAVALALQAPDEPTALRNPARWWDERQLLMRWALSEHQYADAYALAAANGLEPGLDFAEAEFDAGWIALRFLNAPERAEIHFKALASAVSAPISLARSYYWLGRAAEARGADDLAEARYRAAASFIYTFYGQIAAEKIGGPAMQSTFDPPVEPTAEDRARFSSRPGVAALRILSELNNDDQAFLVFAYNVDDRLDTPGEYVELARLAARKGATHIAVRAGKVGVGRNAFAAEVVYPLIFVPDEATRFAPRELILGLSRQESEFNPHAFSRAGARGLMQLLPSTALLTARKEGLRYSRSALLNDPVYNLVVGSAHLAHLLERFNGSWVMTFAAYNAGVVRVEDWVEKFGDPRAPDVDPIDWIEQIPFAETRNYVQRVFENTQVYRSRLTNGPIAGKLHAELEIGGPSRRAGNLPNKQFTETLPPLPQRTILLANAAPLAPSPSRAEASAAAPNGAESDNAATDDTPSLDAEAVNADDAGFDDDHADELSEADQADFEADIDTPPDAPDSAVKSQPALTQFLAPKPSSAQTAEGIDEPPGDTDDADTSRFSPTTAQEDDTSPAPAAAGCQTYRAYISAVDKEDASAADLNAGMLAELEGGASGCAGETDQAQPNED